MNTNTRTSGQAFGSAIGSTAAHLMHFAATAATATGRFGADTVDGVATGYQTTAAVRLAQRQPLHGSLPSSRSRLSA